MIHLEEAPQQETPRRSLHKELETCSDDEVDDEDDD